MILVLGNDYIVVYQFEVPRISSIIKLKKNYEDQGWKEIKESNGAWWPRHGRLKLRACEGGQHEKGPKLGGGGGKHWSPILAPMIDFRL